MDAILQTFPAITIPPAAVMLFSCSWGRFSDCLLYSEEKQNDHICADLEVKMVCILSSKCRPARTFSRSELRTEGTEGAVLND